ncbi:hypothetical protein LZ31DRAFT_64708 [Colletotrichum somersetense]|nr:hypothetical protein LZ31DRAFT_64708 [Colletotrichum somersetense]
MKGSLPSSLLFNASPASAEMYVDRRSGRGMYPNLLKGDYSAARASEHARVLRGELPTSLKQIGHIHTMHLSRRVEC